MACYLAHAHTVLCVFMNTVFIRIVAAATINFAPSSVRLLIEGGSYSRAATIYWGEPERDPHDAVYGDFVCLSCACLFVHVRSHSVYTRVLIQR